MSQRSRVVAGIALFVAALGGGVGFAQEPASEPFAVEYYYKIEGLPFWYGNDQESVSAFVDDSWQISSRFTRFSAGTTLASMGWPDNTALAASRTAAASPSNPISAASAARSRGARVSVAKGARA